MTRKNSTMENRGKGRRAPNLTVLNRPLTSEEWTRLTEWYAKLDPQLIEFVRKERNEPHLLHILCSKSSRGLKLNLKSDNSRLGEDEVMISWRLEKRQSIGFKSNRYLLRAVEYPPNAHKPQE